MNELMDQTLDEFHNEIENTRMDVEITQLPGCVADPQQIQKAFRHLIDNAIQYRRSEDTPHIRITGWEGQHQLFYCVEDDGIGISPDQIQQALAMFGRCAPQKCSGEGLGLPIARRIVEKYGGQIRIESAQNEGTRVFIMFPTE
jgi:light-regulated signal transduction histidine kinase (bacteriophytochrome)